MKIGVAAFAAVLVAAPAAAQWVQAPKAKQSWTEPSPAARPRPQVGSLALARYHGGGYDWPAMVLEVRGNLITVQYSGGDKESLPAALVTPIRWVRGTAIECKFAAKTYAPATITAIDPVSYAMSVVGDDARPHTTSVRFCRSRARI